MSQNKQRAIIMKNTKNMNPKIYLAIGIFLMAIVCIPGIVSAEVEIQKISQWPYGTTHAVLGIENTFFMGSGPSVWIFDATDHSNPVKIGEENFEDPIYGLAAEGNYLYVANGKLRIVDISDLSNPVIVSTCSDCSTNDVKVRGDYAYVVGDGKLQVIDISDKSNPVKIGECDGGSKRLDISGDYAYVVLDIGTTRGLKIINISDPTSPIEVGSWTISSGPLGGHMVRGVKVKGNYAYLADSPYGIWSIDISDPTNPVNVSLAGDEIESWRMDDIDIKGDYAYASCWYRGLIAIDISDPTNISIAREIPSTLGDKSLTGYNSGGVSISGNYAYMGGQYHGAGIYNIATPLSEELLKIVDAYGRSFSLASRDDYAYVTTDNGLAIINVSDTANPALVNRTFLGARSAAITLNDDYAYIGSTWGGLRIADISDPTDPQVFNYGYGFGSSVFHNGYLHALHYEGSNGFYLVLDVSDPANVKEVYSFKLLASYTGLVGTFAIKDNYSYVGLTSKNGLQILDISDPEDITEAGTWLSGDNVNGITIQGNYIYVRTGSELIVGDISSEPANPVELDSWSFSGQYYISTGPHLWQNYLFLAGNSGVLIFDNSDPENISFLKQYDEVTDINDLYFTEDGFMYAAAYEQGVYIHKFIPESDGIPPVITNVNAVAQIHSAIITWDTDEQADSLVKYGTSPGSYTMQASDSSFVLSHSITLTGLSGGTTYYYLVRSKDYSGNPTDSAEYSFTTLSDVAQPVITIINPENDTKIIGGTESINVTITTDEPAWCQYSTSDLEYGEGIDFATGQGTSEHSFVLNLQDGESYTYYYRCIDIVGNKNTVSAVHTFTTATKWWDYFDDETKIESYNDITVSGGTAEITIPDNTVSLSKDAGMYSVQPDDNWDERLQIGGTWRTAIEFTMPDSTGDIESVKLYLYKYETLYAGNNQTISLHKLNGSFVEEQATWNSRSSSELWTNPGAEGDYDSTVIDHYDASGDTAEWHVWTIKGAGADNSLDSLTGGDTVAFILKQSAAATRYEKYNSREAASNIPYIEITLSGSVSGSLISTPISPTSISSWDKFNTNHSTPAGTSISYSILDAQTDATLCSGLTGNNDDISVCLSGVSSIKLKAELTTTNPSATPVLYDWEVSWNVGAVTTGTLTGTVTNGTNPIPNATVSDGTRSDTTLADGTYTLSNVPVGTYTVTCVATGYENGSKSNIAVTEGATTTVDFQLTLSDTTPPTISNIQSSNITTNSATITWTTDENSTSQIEYGLTSSYGSQTTKDETLVISHSVNLTNLSSNTTYHYRIISEDGLGNSSNSIDQTFTTNQSSVPDTTPPQAITDLSSSNITQTSADLSWTSPGDDNNEGTAFEYDIRYSLSNITESNWNSATQITGEPIPQSAGTEQSIYIAVGLSPSTKYYFAIKTSDEVPNTSDISNVISFTTQSSSGGGGGGTASDTTPPSKPSNFTATGADKQITLSWTNPTESDFVRILLIKKEDSFPTSKDDGIVIYEGTNQEYIDIELDNNTTYYYSIFAYDKKPNYSEALSISAKPIEGKTSIPNGNGKQTYPEGTLIKIPESFKIYVIINQKKKWIPTPEVFETLGYEWTNITEINKTELNNIPNYEDNLIRAIQDYKVYLIVNGIKRHIPNPEIFLNYGFEWNDVKDVKQETINKYSQNLLIKESKQNKVYYLCPERKIRRWLRSPEIFNSYNNRWEDIQVISKYEMEHYQESNLIRQYNNNNVYLIEANKKRLIQSAEEFERLGLDWEMVMEVGEVEMGW